MAILRKVKKNDYTIIDNNIFKNTKLTLKAKGMICTMLSLPDNWVFNEMGLTQLSNDSRTGIRSTLKELQEFGYLKRERARDEKGILRDTIYTIYEEPMYQKPTLDKPTLDKKHYKELIDKELNNKKEIYKERFIKPTFEEIEKYIEEKNMNVNAQTFYNYFTESNWVDSKGNKVKNWKQKLITWNSYNKVEAKVPSWFNNVEQKEISNEDVKELETLIEKLESE
jgi:hypothetical protein